MLSFATGNLWCWGLNRGKYLDFIRTLPVDGVELTMGFPDDVKAFTLSNKNLKWLKSLDYVSLHAPFGHSRFPDEVMKSMKKIEKVYKQVNAKTLVVHAIDPELVDLTYKNDVFNIAIENMEKRFDFPLSDFTKFIKKYPKANICMDVSHNYTWSINDTKLMIKKFKDRISHIHFSGSYRGSSHEMMGTSAKNFFKSINPIKNTNIPLIIEEDMNTRNKAKVKKEVRFIRNLLF